jgi:hypothetical protein
MVLVILLCGQSPFGPQTMCWMMSRNCRMRSNPSVKKSRLSLSPLASRLSTLIMRHILRKAEAARIFRNSQARIAQRIYSNGIEGNLCQSFAIYYANLDCLASAANYPDSFSAIMLLHKNTWELLFRALIRVIRRRLAY